MEAGKLICIATLILGAICFELVLGQNQCQLLVERRLDCSVSGGAEDCERAGCCYDPQDYANTPKCYFAANRLPSYSEWNEWTECGRTCGSSSQRRTRRCLYWDRRVAPRELCQSGSTAGTLIEQQACNNGDCPEVTPGTSCVELPRHTATCRARTRDCRNDTAVARRCPITCGFCPSVSTTAASCSDSNPLCPGFQRFCQSLGYVRDLCKVTCDNCGDQAGGNGPSASTASTTTTT
uniref:P-type domain-containing protein n=2 Tax=Ciona intestinalis TaxID=7719 RepID=F7BBV1_CIOIN